MNRTLIYSLFVAFAILSLGAVILPSNMVNMASAQLDTVTGLLESLGLGSLLGSIGVGA